MLYIFTYSCPLTHNGHFTNSVPRAFSLPYWQWLHTFLCSRDNILSMVGFESLHWILQYLSYRETIIFHRFL